MTSASRQEAPIAPAVPASAALRHTTFEDVQALVAGTLLVSLGAALVGKAGLITGGVVGLAFLLHYATDISFGKLFFFINLPFYMLAVKKLGWEFALKTFTAVLLLSTFSELLPLGLQFDVVQPVYAAIMGGILMGVGLLVLFRHKASLGGVNVLCIFLQGRFGWRAGAVQLVFDAAILLLSAPLISPLAMALSLFGAVVLNMTLAVNHRPGRYMTM